MDYTKQRNNMVEHQIKARGITDERLLDALRKVERHLFIPGHSDHFAYSDGPMCIGEGQTISQPYIVALMLDMLKIKPEDIVLEIGTGSGYQTAIIAEIAGEVYSVERIPSLARNARKILDTLGYSNIKIQQGDGTIGWKPEKENEKDITFDAIIVSAAAPSIPEGLLTQLKEGGRLVLPCGSRFVQDLVCVRKENGNIIKENFGGCQFVPLIGEQGW
ncbi:MAG: protein-L-isoaspartate(D-aspartate) O-methyltransferase [Candidatus Celaenobacter antarcticus]|nr:protein-L-isoaspartate(D-aspartate) O-methyltransferase [Candidatus Celaenobacter antarcticus]